MRFYSMKRGTNIAERWVVRMMTLWLMLSLLETKAQDSCSVSMYWAVPTLINPATAGKDTALHITAYGRNQWVGMDTSPQTYFVAADMPFKVKKAKMGVGISMQNTKTDLTKANVLAIQYAYSTKLWGGQIAIGLQAGKIEQTLKTSSEKTSTSVDLAAGLYYQRSFGKGQAYAGLSATHLNEASVTIDTISTFQQKRTYYFLVGGNIPTRNTLLIIQPSLLLKANGTATTIDCTLRATYNRRYWGGVSYRYDDGVVVMAGADIKAFRIGYAYDIGTSGDAKHSKGSHEVMLSYLMKINLDKKKRAPQKSIRLL